MNKIHDLTIDWLTRQGRLIVGELYISCYHAVSESESGKPVWAFKIEEDLVITQPDKLINLLCQISHEGKDFYHLKLPSGFLSACRHLLAFDDSSKCFILHLSADPAALFCELNGQGSVGFGIFNVDPQT